jgi:hypothetical protein
MKDNPRERSSFAILALALVLFLTLPLAAYVAGYFWLGNYESGENDDGAVEYVWRDYPQQWLTDIYSPAGQVESWLRRIEVTISGPNSGVL